MNRYQAHQIKGKGETMSDWYERLMLISAVFALISIVSLGIAIGLMASVVIR